MKILRSLIVPAAAAIAVAAPAPAGASTDPVVAAGPDGGAQFAWGETAAGTQTMERSLSGSGSLSGVQTISWAYRNVLEQRVGADASGAAVFAWRSTGDGVMAAYIRRRVPSGSLSAIQRLTPLGASAQDLRLVVEPDGDAVAVWRSDVDGRSVVQLRRRSATGTLGTVRTVSDPAASSYQPEVAVTPTGAATVAWSRNVDGGNVVETRTFAADGSQSAIQPVSETGETVNDVSVTVSDAGTAVIAWNRMVDGEARLESRARGAGGALGPVQTVVPAETFGAFQALAGNGAGRTLYVWSHTPAGASAPTIKARVRRADGVLNPAFDVTSTASTPVRAGMDADGDTTFAWRQASGNASSIRAVRRTVNGAMGPVRVLSDPMVPSYEPHLAVDGPGKATVAWHSAAGAWLARTVTPGGTVSPFHYLTEEG